MKHPPHHGRQLADDASRRGLAAAAIIALASGLLTACSCESARARRRSSGTSTRTPAARRKVAANCSTDQYTITTQVLPQDANEQRDPAGPAARRPGLGHRHHEHRPPVHRGVLERRLPGPAPAEPAGQAEPAVVQERRPTAATWDGKLVVAPFWSNTQVLWYRKSFVQKAGIDMSKPVTWDQIINAAAENGGKVAVQSNKYEGYVVWINALISGAGGEIATDTSKGLDMKLEINSPAGEKAAAVIEKLAHSPAAPADLSVAQEGQAGTTFATPQGSFMVNWTYIYNNYEATDPGFNKDIGYTRYPETVQGEPSRPPYGGIGLGVSTYSNHVDDAMQAVECLTSPENQEVNAEITGNMPASQAGYDSQRQRPAEDLPGAPAEALPAEPRRGSTPHQDAVLERHLRRPPVHVAPAVGREPVDAGHITDVHRQRPPRKEPAVTTSTATVADAPGGRAYRPQAEERPIRGREPARPEARRPCGHRDAAGDRLADDPGALPLAVPVPADHAERQGVHLVQQLRHGADRQPVLEGHRQHRDHHGGHRGGRAGHRLRLRHGDAPDHLRPRGDAGPRS